MPIGIPPLKVREVDSSPSQLPIFELVFNNGTVSISGTTATIDNTGSVVTQTYLYDTLTNSTGSTLSNGRVVKLASTDHIEYASNDSEANAEAIGILIEDVNDGDSGKVVTSGILPVGSVSGFTSGDSIYLDSANGQVTATVPTSGVIFYIGKYNNGKVYLDIRHISTLST